MTTRDEDVLQLTSMGFPIEEARKALQISGDVETAIDRLLSGEGFLSENSINDGVMTSSGSTHNVSNDNLPVVRGSTSQYSYGSDGRSACTCIALTAADIVANAVAGKDDNQDAIITTDFLDRSIIEGVARYKQLRDALGSNGVEHMSAEEVLLKDDERVTSGVLSSNNNSVGHIFDVRLSEAGGGRRVRQGALSRDIDHPLGMKCVLQGLLDEIREERRDQSLQNEHDGSKHVASNHPSAPMIPILLTKSPETVLLCIPATDCKSDNTNSSQNGAAIQKQQYWLIDSHPRPQLLSGVETSYAKPHNSFDSLLQTLREIFPVTDLGPDIPPMMSEMYNMFDLYALEGRKH